jgi:Trk-type K+ transport system membrane component
MVLLGFIYVLILKKYELKDTIDNEKDDIEKNKLRNYYDNFVLINNTLFITVIILTIIGFILYYVEKKHEYKKDFNFIVFLLGKTDCRYRNSDISIMNSLKYSIKN